MPPVSLNWPRNGVIRKNRFPLSFLGIVTRRNSHKQEEKEQRKTQRKIKRKDKINLQRKFGWETNN